MNHRTRVDTYRFVVAVGACIFACIVSSSSQVQTTTTKTRQPASKQIEVENAEVIYVKGHDLVLKMSDGSIRHISNVPDSERAIVDGKEIGIKDVQVGMKLQRTITTTTTPEVVTTVQTVQGKVFHVSPPDTVILTLENGQNQRFTIPKGQMFLVNGQEKDAWGLRKGMLVSATKVVEEPITVVEREKKITGQMPPPPPALDLSPSLPLLVVVAVPPPTHSVTVEHGPVTLPNTASELPLLALLGGSFLVGALGLRLFRRPRV